MIRYTRRHGGLIHWLRRMLFWPACQRPWPRTVEHSFVSTAMFKRQCSRCGREEWMMSHPYPAVGEPALTWEGMHDPFPDRHYSAKVARWLKRQQRKAS